MSIQPSYNTASACTCADGTPPRVGHARQCPPGHATGCTDSVFCPTMTPAFTSSTRFYPLCAPVYARRPSGMMLYPDGNGITRHRPLPFPEHLKYSSPAPSSYASSCPSCR